MELKSEYEWLVIELPRNKEGIGLVACSGTTTTMDEAQLEAAHYATHYVDMARNRLKEMGMTQEEAFGWIKAWASGAGDGID